MNLMTLKQPIVFTMNGNIYRISGPFLVRTKIAAFEQDYKTAIILGSQPIPKNTELKVFNILNNYYGSFFQVRFNGVLYNIDPDDCEYIKSLDIVNELSESDIHKIKQFLLNKYQPLNKFELDATEYANALWKKFLETSKEFQQEVFSAVL